MPKVIQNVEKEIINQARSMLSQIGYDALNMRDLAQKCGISVGTLYNHFPAKKDIILSIIGEAWDQTFAEIDRQTAGPDEPLEQMMKIYRLLKGGYDTSHRTFTEGFDSMARDMSTMEARSCRDDIRERLMQRVLDLLQNDPAKKDPAVSLYADAIARLISAYCAEKSVNEQDMQRIISPLVAEADKAQAKR
jgi:AcrR family transcriptional regulator